MQALLGADLTNIDSVLDPFKRRAKATVKLNDPAKPLMQLDLERQTHWRRPRASIETILITEYTRLNDSEEKDEHLLKKSQP